MSLYQPLNAKSPAIAICNRCQMKMNYVDLRKDPNNGNFYCKDCVDEYDPWRLPARSPENISLDHPRKDVELV